VQQQGVQGFLAGHCLIPAQYPAERSFAFRLLLKAVLGLINYSHRAICMDV
jgi:hypothetical protein